MKKGTNMFSGLVTGGAKIAALASDKQTIQMTVACPDNFLAGAKLGESIAVNGTCLTADEIKDNQFKVTMMPQTFKKTIFKNSQVGDAVNIERALQVHDRLEGHILTGHVDETVKVLEKKRNQNAIELSFQRPARLRSQIVAQGSVGLNGVSLTVMKVTANSFSVGLIPHTQDETNLAILKTGDEVNLETDILGKYVAANLKKDA